MFIIKKKKIKSIRSFQSLIKKQMIMLSLHSQLAAI